MTEDKIRDAYNNLIYSNQEFDTPGNYVFFKRGYLAMLNSLVPRYHIAANEMMYQLPEGVSRNE